MKKNIFKLLFILAVITSSLVVKAQPALKWSFNCKKTGPGAYSINATSTLPEGWYVYGINKNIEGLTPPVFKFQYEKVGVVSNPDFTTAPSTLKDPLFNNLPATVYKGTFKITLQIAVNGIIPPDFKGTLTTFASNGKEFYPMEEKFEIPVPGVARTATDQAQIKIATIDL